jgi:O-antigen/teichoic acid export membrane protein
MLQAQARLSLVLRQFVFLTVIAALAYAGQAELLWVLVAEVGASALGLLVAGIGIAQHLRTLREQVAEPGWQEPRIVEQWRIALRMHAAHIVTLAYGPQVFLNLVQRALGAEAAALFGFIRVLADQVARYLPALLLFTVLRPKLMASHIQGGMVALAWQVNLVGKLSLFVLLPIIVLVALVGDTLVAMLSGSKFTEGGAYLLGLLLALVPLSQRQLIETVAVAEDRAILCTLGALVGLLALPLMLVLLDMGFGLWAPVLAILFGQFSFNTTVLTGLYRNGYQADWQGAAKLGASAFLAWLVAKWVLVIDSSIVFLVAACLLGAVVFLTLVWRTQAFTALERQRLDGLLGRRLFAR